MHFKTWKTCTLIGPSWPFWLTLCKIWMSASALLLVFRVRSFNLQHNLSNQRTFVFLFYEAEKFHSKNLDLWVNSALNSGFIECCEAAAVLMTNAVDTQAFRWCDCLNISQMFLEQNPCCLQLKLVTKGLVHLFFNHCLVFECCVYRMFYLWLLDLVFQGQSQRGTKGRGRGCTEGPAECPLTTLRYSHTCI